MREKKIIWAAYGVYAGRRAKKRGGVSPVIFTYLAIATAVLFFHPSSII